MPKVNPWSLPVRTWKPATKSFTDPDVPGVDFTLTVRPLDGCELMLALETADTLIQRYIGSETKDPEQDYPFPGVALSERLLQGACLIAAQQLQPDGEPYDPENYYNVDDLIGVAARAGKAWGALSSWASGFLDAPEGPKGNAGSAAGKSSSAPSSTTDTPTLTSSSANTE